MFERPYEVESRDLRPRARRDRYATYLFTAKEAVKNTYSSIRYEPKKTPGTQMSKSASSDEIQLISLHSRCCCVTTHRPSAGASLKKSTSCPLRENRLQLRERLNIVQQKTIAAADQAGRAYDWNQSTRDNYQAAEGSPGYGQFTEPYAGPRAMLDVSHHGCYTVERQAIQDDLVRNVLASSGGSQHAPWIVFTAGAMGAGKSWTMAWLSANNIFPLSEVVQVDPDLFKAALPEWPTLIERGPLSAGYHTRSETGMLCEIAQEAAMRESRHVWVDGSLRNGSWYQHVFTDIAKRYPHYQIAIFHVTASREATFERARARGEMTGRHVPPEEIEDSLRRVPAAVDLLAPLAQFVATIDNSAETPTLVRWRDNLKNTEGTAPEGGTCAWQAIYSRFRFKGFWNLPRASMIGIGSRPSGLNNTRGSAIFPKPTRRSRTTTFGDLSAKTEAWITRSASFSGAKPLQNAANEGCSPPRVRSMATT